MPRWIVAIAAFFALLLAIALGGALLGGYLWFEGYGLPESVRDRLPPGVARIVATATGTPTPTPTPTTTATPAATPTATVTPTATLTSTPTATPTSTAPPPSPTPEPLPGRLAIVGGDGNIYTVRPDGSDSVAVTANATPGARVYGQLAWSPGSARLAWTEVVRSGRQTTTSLLIALANGSELQRTAAAGTPLAVYWSPDEERVALLSLTSGVSELRLVEGANLGRQARLLARGAQLYFTWAPDSPRLLAHSDDRPLSLLALDGSTTGLPGTPGDFGTPAWSADGKRLVYALREGGSQRLVIAAPDGKVERRLAEYEGHAAFTLSPDGRRLAYISTLAALRLAALGPLYVVGDEASAPVQVVAGHVLAAFWSPDGSRLLALSIENASAGWQLFRGRTPAANRARLAALARVGRAADNRPGAISAHGPDVGGAVGALRSAGPRHHPLVA